MLVSAEGVPSYSVSYLYTPTTEGTATITVNGETSATVYVNAEAMTESSTIVNVAGSTDEDTQETTYTPVQIYVEFTDLEGFLLGNELNDGETFTDDMLNVLITLTFSAK